MKDLAGQPLARRDAIAWTASMISPQFDGGVETPASFVAKNFTLDRVPGDGRLVILAQGFYRAFLNGERVGQDKVTVQLTLYNFQRQFSSEFNLLLMNVLLEGAEHRFVA